MRLQRISRKVDTDTRLCLLKGRCDGKATGDAKRAKSKPTVPHRSAQRLLAMDCHLDQSPACAQFTLYRSRMPRLAALCQSAPGRERPPLVAAAHQVARRGAATRDRRAPGDLAR